MKNIHTVTELVYCENKIEETGRKFGIALWSEEEKPGFPVVIMSIEGEEFQISLQDVVGIERVIQSFYREIERVK